MTSDLVISSSTSAGSSSSSTRYATLSPCESPGINSSTSNSNSNCIVSNSYDSDSDIDTDWDHTHSPRHHPSVPHPHSSPFSSPQLTPSALRSFPGLFLSESPEKQFQDCAIAAVTANALELSASSIRRLSFAGGPIPTYRRIGESALGYSDGLGASGSGFTRCFRQLVYSHVSPIIVIDNDDIINEKAATTDSDSQLLMSSSSVFCKCFSCFGPSVEEAALKLEAAVKQRRDAWKNKWKKAVRSLAVFRINRYNLVFGAIVRLYAHEEQSEVQIRQIIVRYPLIIEFFSPQLCNFLLYGSAYELREPLEQIFLESCQSSLSMALNVYWTVRSLHVEDVNSLLKSPDIPSMDIALKIDEAFRNFLVLIIHQGRAAPCPIGRYGIVSNNSNDVMTPTTSGQYLDGPSPSIELRSLDLRNVHFDDNDRATSKVNLISSPLSDTGSDPIDNERNINPKNEKSERDAVDEGIQNNVVENSIISTTSLNASPATADDSVFTHCVSFLDRLTSISATVNLSPKPKRNEALRHQISELNKLLPIDAIFPVLKEGDYFHRIVRVSLPRTDSVLHSATRSPYIVVIEVVEHECREIMIPITTLRELSLTLVNNNSINSNANDSTVTIIPTSSTSITSVNVASASTSNVASSDITTTSPLPIPSISSSNTTSNVVNNVSLSRLESRPAEMGYDASDEIFDVPERSVSGVSSIMSPSSPTIVPFTIPSDDFSPFNICGFESWKNTLERLKSSSPFGHLSNWRAFSAIIKANDDLRQEQFAVQLIEAFRRIFKEERLPLWMASYRVLATSPSSGIIETVTDAHSLDQIRKRLPNYSTLKEFYERTFKQQSTAAYEAAKDAFTESMAAYSMVCYLLQIKDRHNGNILIDRYGHVMHIDFGFLLSNSPGGNMGFERAPFKLTNEFVELMGGSRSRRFRRFRDLCVKAYLAARRKHAQIMLLLEMQGHCTTMPCFQAGVRATVDMVQQRFHLDWTERRCVEFVHSLIDDSLDNWRTRWYDKYQRCWTGVF